MCVYIYIYIHIFIHTQHQLTLAALSLRNTKSEAAEEFMLLLRRAKAHGKKESVFSPTPVVLTSACSFTNYLSLLV